MQTQKTGNKTNGTTNGRRSAGNRVVKGLVVAAPASNSGKTTFTLGLLAALE